jgi:hypothetical protein
MNDDEMDELLTQGTRDYNEPGAVPRDAMWARIQRERHAGSGSGGRAPIRRRWPWVAGGLAAALVLAAGIAIGRRLERGQAPNAPTVARTPAAAPRDSGPTQVASAPDSIVRALRGETRKTQESVTRLAEQSPSATGGSTSDSDNLAYRLVMLRHIAGSEAMITAFRAAARRGEVDAQIAGWSRELLSTTRMLEASPVTQDPVMKRLLEDLDLVIVQIAQYTTTGKHNPDDLDLIEQSIDKRGVMTKLRSSLPARTLPAGT